VQRLEDEFCQAFVVASILDKMSHQVSTDVVPPGGHVFIVEQSIYPVHLSNIYHFYRSEVTLASCYLFAMMVFQDLCVII